ncbi:elongation factor ts : Elongation factor Ts OS=Planctomyces brasiliensis (strain ATCC 49424 / DSM 5305 / JCM 21570 / NBRC 103401 / IFAM 1448) GN=tsf PE=3 SV=1: UBA: EF_TS [Gemmata obscuriglobus UQM 2246]|nr:translation elongation factor Ts [Gemmata obscuriglobus]VTS08115.1 elongation factor ts : Elongation factor Ts OS=Planctomyces brasiliensis (strain ATCC 49424 / DSM 5305 / JCM 21570 / NBRC 103401 / IFAM 1448) GN=tsf PE=3 SV=1: UBA: EF_TS [Gemmata obscuriglobus UQM 2246]
MAAVTPQMVKQLRDRTDQPMGLCKQALDESTGDMEKAIEWLQKQNSKMTAKREGNETAEGRIGVFADNAAKVAAIVEMRCESAPSAKSDQFVALTADLAKAAAATKTADVASLLVEPLGGGTVQTRIEAVVGVIREKMVLHRFQKLDGGVYGGYVHHDGSVGVVIECKGETANDELLRDVAAHIAALNPPYAVTSDVPRTWSRRKRGWSRPTWTPTRKTRASPPTSWKRSRKVSSAPGCRKSSSASSRWPTPASTRTPAWAPR